MNQTALVPKCPVNYTIELISSKWKIELLHQMRSGAKRPSQLMRALTGISQKVLTKSLKELEYDNLISRKLCSQKPLKTEYSLTEKGMSLVIILDDIAQWGERFL